MTWTTTNTNPYVVHAKIAERMERAQERREREADIMWCGVCNERVTKLSCPDAETGQRYTDCSCLIQ